MGLFGLTTMVTAVVLAVVAYMWGNRIPLIKKIGNPFMKGIVVFLGSFLLMGGSLTALGLGTTASMGAAVSGEIASQQVKTLNFASQDWKYNTTATGDFYTNNDQLVSIYVTDAVIGDDLYINGTLTIERVNSVDAGSILVSCTSSDFTKSGTTYNIVSKDTNSKMEMYLGTQGSGGTRTTTGVSANSDFTAGDSSNTMLFSFKQDEAAEDILSTKEMAPQIVCTAGGVNAVVQIIAND